MDHHSNYEHANHLDYFTTASTIIAKKAYEHRAFSCEKAVINFRSDNSGLSDPDFIRNLHENRQEIEFCGVRAHYQNGINERAI